MRLRALVHEISPRESTNDCQNFMHSDLQSCPARWSRPQRVFWVLALVEWIVSYAMYVRSGCTHAAQHHRPDPTPTHDLNPAFTTRHTDVFVLATCRTQQRYRHWLSPMPQPLVNARSQLLIG